MATFTELLDTLHSFDPTATAKAETRGARTYLRVSFTFPSNGAVRSLYFGESVTIGDMAALQSEGARLIRMALDVGFGWRG